jgi:hypothetical protein
MVVLKFNQNYFHIFHFNYFFRKVKVDCLWQIIYREKLFKEILTVF